MRWRATNRFDDGAAYERMMGAGASSPRVFWTGCAAAGLRWIDVGCGNGAFTN